MQLTPKGVVSLDIEDKVPIQTWQPEMADSIDELLLWRWANAAERNATPTADLQVGAMGYTISEKNQMYRWTGTAWESITDISTANLSTENLNDVRETSLRFQPQNANATSARNYPVPYAGSLESIFRSDLNNFGNQRYTVYNTRDSYIRNLYSGTWSPWYKQARYNNVAGDELEANRYFMAGDSNSTAETGFRANRNGVFVKMYQTGSASNPAMGLLTNDGADNGHIVYIENSGVLHKRHGGVNRPVPFAEAGGFLAVSGAANTNRRVDITYPSGRFTQRPNVQVSMRSINPNNGRVSYDYDTETGVSLYLYYSTTTTITVSWSATQMTPTATSG